MALERTRKMTPWKDAWATYKAAEHQAHDRCMARLRYLDREHQKAEIQVWKEYYDALQVARGERDTVLDAYPERLVKAG